MARNVDCRCPTGPHEFERICEPDTIIICPDHLQPCEQLWWQPSRRRRQTVWDKSEWAYVDKRPDGTYSFPMRPDLKPPAPGNERITIKSEAEMAAIESAAHVRSERRWFDRGSGRDFDGDKTLPSFPSRVR